MSQAVMRFIPDGRQSINHQDINLSSSQMTMCTVSPPPMHPLWTAAITGFVHCNLKHTGNKTKHYVQYKQPLGIPLPKARIKQYSMSHYGKIVKQCNI